MSVRHALLALLSEGPKYGLQLRQEFEARTGRGVALERGPGVHNAPTPRARRAGRVGLHRSRSHSSRNWSTAVGLLVALGVLAMTVGLIRTETASDLRTLTATGASSTIRRTLTSATAGALALLGAVLGTAGAYLALVAWHRSHLHQLTHVPLVDLVVIIVGLPLAATIAGWLLAGREPPTIARQPLE